MDLITTAIIAALTDLTKDVVKNSYNSLKAALKKKRGPGSDLMNAVTELEKKPESDGRKITLQEEVERAKVNDNPDIIILAQALLDNIKEQPGGQQIVHQTQTNTVSGVTVGRDFEFKPVQKGEHS